MTRRRSFAGRLLAFAILAGATLAGCLPPVKAAVSVTDLASVFPTITRLGVRSLSMEERSDQPDCVFFEYKRGAFTSNPSDESCQVGFRGPGSPHLTPFDPPALKDVADLEAEFARFGVPIAYISINRIAGGAIGADSVFSADSCVTYVYSPGWTHLPEDAKGEVSTAIDADWYKSDECP